MTGSSTLAKVLNAALLLSGILGHASAARRLHQEAECDVVLQATDLNKGVGDLPGGGPVDTQEACVDLCESVQGCNAAIFVSNGNCFIKNVDLSTVSLDPDPSITSYILCDVPASNDVARITPPGDVESFECGQFAPGIDIPNENIGGGASATNEECLEMCTNTEGCNAVVRAGVGGDCFLKWVDVDSVLPMAAAGLTSYVVCDGEVAMSPEDSAAAPEDSQTPEDPADLASGPAAEEESEIAAVGQWGDVIPFPVIPVASAALPDGKVLVWSGDSVDHFLPAEGTPGVTFYAVFDSNSDTVGELQSADLGHDMFCPGISILPNSQVFVVGGSAGGDGHAHSSKFGGSEFSEGPRLNTPRGYNSAVTLASGEVMTLGGSFSGEISTDKGAEIYSGDAWRAVPNIRGAQILSDDPQGPFRTDNYPHLFAWTNNSVFHAGPSEGMNWFTGLEGEGLTTAAGERGATAMNGNAVMYAAGQILTVGGAPSFSLGHEARSGAEVITLGEPGSAPDVEEVEAPATARTYANAVVLPNGEVAYIGGAATAVEFSDADAVLDTEIWNPESRTWTLDAATDIPRTYHSSAVLIPDGRVFVGGGGLCGGCEVNHLDAQMFSPRYLFNADNSPAERPTISLSATTAAPGDEMTITGSEDLAMVAMVRMSASTHSLNTDQRRLELCGAATAACGGEVAEVDIPAAGVTVPGPWMVFGFNAAGVPSVAQILTVT